MKKQTATQSIYKRFKQFIIMGTVAILTVTTTATATAPNVETLKQQAEQGDADAQVNLGAMYHLGQGVTQDYKKAVYWYTQASEQGHAYAQYFLGFMYQYGQGVPQDYKKAVALFTQASEQVYLGLMYYTGQGVVQNSKKAVALFTQASEQGNAKAKKALELLGIK